uniref:Uncharacterized protein n=1 Tax=Arundo donax TaxID=35708 RepID=A0A0A8YAW2_ARUDO
MHSNLNICLINRKSLLCSSSQS